MTFDASRGLLILAMIGLMALAALGFRAQEIDMEALRTSNEENIHWSAAQVEVELARFVATLGQFSLGDPEVTRDDVNNRFDILWSRTGLFRNGRVGDRLRTYDRDIDAIGGVMTLLERYEADIVNLEREDRALHQQIMFDFNELGDRLRRLSIRVVSGEEDRFATVRENLRNSGLMTWVVSTAALLVATALVGVMLIENRRYRRITRESAELAAEAERANRDKSRFLTMMSHELRTPMNGVLGLMALAKQSGLSERQLRLIEQAERSGEQMIGLLGDILDYSDLESERMELENAPFRLGDISSALQDAVQGAAHREGTTIEVRSGTESQSLIVADFARFRQALSHFVHFLIEIVGSKDIKIRMDHANGQLSAIIDVVVHDEDHPGWQPEAMFERDSTGYGDFASDTLGPMIGRGLVQKMGGTVVIERTEPGHAMVIVMVPADAVKRDNNMVRVEAKSATTRALIHGAVANLPLSEWTPRNDPALVSVVLIEVGGKDDVGTIARLRAAHPSARIVAVGLPENPALFDGICSVPVTAGKLRAHLKDVWAA